MTVITDLPANLPAWAALLTAACVVAGALIALIGSIGLLRLPSFFERLHAPTLGTSFGTGSMVLASIVFFSALRSDLLLHALLIGAFVTVTTPVTFMVLARAVLRRKRSERNAATTGTR